MAFWAESLSVIVVVAESVTVPSICSAVAGAVPVPLSEIVPPVMVSSTSSTVPPSSARMMLVRASTLVTSLSISSIPPTLRLQRGIRLVGDGVRRRC